MILERIGVRDWVSDAFDVEVLLLVVGWVGRRGGVLVWLEGMVRYLLVFQDRSTLCARD